MIKINEMSIYYEDCNIAAFITECKDVHRYGEFYQIGGYLGWHTGTKKLVYWRFDWNEQMKELILNVVKCITPLEGD